MNKLYVLKNMGPVSPRGLGPIKKNGRKDRAEGPGGQTDRAEGPGGRKDQAEGPGGRTGRTDRPGGRNPPLPRKSWKSNVFENMEKMRVEILRR